MKLRTILTVAAAAIIIPAMSFALGEGPGKGLVITDVAMNFGTGHMTIYGENFDFGPGPFMVIGKGEDVTGFCELIDSTEIDCDFTGAMPDDGEYLLVVSNGPGESQNDEFDLSIRRTLLDGGILYTVREANGANTTNNKLSDASCAAGDVLLSGGVEIYSGDVTADVLAGCVSILENRPLGGATAWRGRAVEEFGDCLGGRTTWTLRTWAVCLDATP